MFPVNINHAWLSESLIVVQVFLANVLRRHRSAQETKPETMPIRSGR